MRLLEWCFLGQDTTVASRRCPAAAYFAGAGIYVDRHDGTPGFLKC